MNRNEVYKALDSERDYQDARWGFPHPRTAGEFLLYMQDYLTQAIHQASREPDMPGAAHCSQDTLDTIRKITALGVACLEQHGVQPRTKDWIECAKKKQV